ncbi:MAG: hypothetical protein WCX65_10735 [bacterium]
MNKQLTIFCSSEISDMVIGILSSSGIKGFMHLQGTGTNVIKKTAFAHDLTWPADVFIVPAEEQPIRNILEHLKNYAGKCEIEPCLKLILSSVDEMY